MKPHVRLTPAFMNLKAAGRPHGLALAGDDFDTKEQAEAFADTVDRFMDAMIQNSEKYKSRE